MFAVGTNLGEFQKQVLGTVEKTGLEIILPEFHQRVTTLFLVERGPRDQVLVNADGALDFAAAAEQVSQRQVRLHGIRIDFQHPNEHFDCLVRLLIQQEIEAREIGGREIEGFPCAPAPAGVASAPPCAGWRDSRPPRRWRNWSATPATAVRSI